MPFFSSLHHVPLKRLTQTSSEAEIGETEAWFTTVAEVAADLSAIRVLAATRVAVPVESPICEAGSTGEAVFAAEVLGSEACQQLPGMGMSFWPNRSLSQGSGLRRCGNGG